MIRHFWLWLRLSQGRVFLQVFGLSVWRLYVSKMQQLKTLLDSFSWINVASISRITKMLSHRWWRVAWAVRPRTAWLSTLRPALKTEVGGAVERSKLLRLGLFARLTPGLSNSLLPVHFDVKLHFDNNKLSSISACFCLFLLLSLESGRPDSWKIRSTLFGALVFQIRAILKKSENSQKRLKNKRQTKIKKTASFFNHW